MSSPAGNASLPMMGAVDATVTAVTETLIHGDRYLDLAIATDGLEARIEYEIGHDDLLIVNTKSGLTQRADDHTRKIDLARELSGYPRLFPQFSNRAASKRFAG